MSGSPVYVDAFCGAGGLSLGLKRAGFRPGAAFDINPHAIRTYRRNLGEHATVCDVRDVTPKELGRLAGVPPDSFTLVGGGPPCQGFSVQRRDGHDDPRNSLPLAYLSLIKKLRPPFFLFENVPGMKGRHGEEILKAFLEDAAAADYVCHMKLLDSVEYGVPQSRRRLFIVGEHAPDGRTWFGYPAPITSHNSPQVTVGAALSDLPPPPEDYSEHPSLANHKRMRLSPLNQKRLSHVPQGGGMEDLPPELRVNCHRNGAAKIGHRYVYGRLHWNEPAATITARFDSFTRGKFGHPLEDRNITLREGARLQTFPDDFVFEGTQEEIAMQIGNAIPPRLAEVLGRAILEAMQRKADGEPARSERVPMTQQSLLFQ